ncbi:MAG: PIN domain-containing protein [bacterium]|nr:PIN domain-containing protein [bacterium]
MKILLDTDILLDIALRRAAFFEDSAVVVAWAESEPGQGAIAWHSLSNIAYLLRPDARPFIRELLLFTEIPATGTSAAKQAMDFPMKDLEDSLQAAAALRFGASYIVTRNIGHYKNSPVPAVTPKEFLCAIGKI